MLHTTGILLEGSEGEKPCIGFYSWRRARGTTSREAYDAAMAAMDDDPGLRDIIVAAHEAGLQPQTVAEKTYEIPWWRAFLPWREPGLYLYSEDDGDSDAG
ncbi:MAG: hypothetical protein EOP85_07570 [Verrucomicrobiaceae bacterium]|nr:MAG: hypothetical protein EOP85_07570 [Verrucomicrobiaceae bacterium]